MSLTKEQLELYNKKVEIEARIKNGDQFIDEAKRKLNQLKDLYCSIETKIRRTVYDPKIESSIYVRSDYTGFSTGDYSFYFGYESLGEHPVSVLDKEIAKEKKKRKGQDWNESDDDDWNPKSIWCFTVDKDGKEIYKKPIPSEDIGGNVLFGLLSGIGYWLRDEVLINSKWGSND
jgi:hypothetical protein